MAVIVPGKPTHSSHNDEPHSTHTFTTRQQQRGLEHTAWYVSCGKSKLPGWRSTAVISASRGLGLPSRAATARSTALVFRFLQLCIFNTICVQRGAKYSAAAPEL